MIHPILGLHHVTATVDDAQGDLDFCLDLLGMRLVKKTVNFDNHNVYHFYYGNERGEPGTIWTTFPYKGRGVRVGVKGTGQVVTTSFSVPVASLGFWRRRLKDRGVEARDVETRLGDEAIRIPDPSGLWLELVANDRDSRMPWTGNGVGAGASSWRPAVASQRPVRTRHENTRASRPTWTMNPTQAPGAPSPSGRARTYATGSRSAHDATMLVRIANRASPALVRAK